MRVRLCWLSSDASACSEATTFLSQLCLHTSGLPPNLPPPTPIVGWRPPCRLVGQCHLDAAAKKMRGKLNVIQLFKRVLVTWINMRIHAWTFYISRRKGRNSEGVEIVGRALPLLGANIINLLYWFGVVWDHGPTKFWGHLCLIVAQRCGTFS